MDREERIRRPHVLVGYDGTPDSDAALRWAVDAARRRDVALELCHCWRWPYASGHVDAAAEAVVKRAGENLLESGARRAEELGAPLVRRRLLPGPVTEALLGASATAELVVLGAHERPEPGTAALEVPARSDRPVVVVRDAGEPPGPSSGARPLNGGGRGLEDGPVVVGVDGTARCDPALGFAFAEAALRDGGLRVVYGCWEPAAVADAELALFTDRDLLEKTRAAELEEAVAPWRDRYPTVEVTVSLLLERPCAALRDAVQGAALLVLGARGTGTDPLGATTTSMVRDAPCPVAIVPGHPAH